MAMTLDELTAALKTDSYTPRTDADMQAEAERRYASTKNMNKLAAQQAYDATDLALSSQLGRLNSTYDQQYVKAQQQLHQSASQLDRYSLQRGMQRSSYNAQAQANLAVEYGKTLNQIEQARTDALGNIEAQRTQAAQQLADQLAQYDADYAADVQAYLDELKDKDYERAQAAAQYGNQIQMQLYEYGLKDPREALGGSSGGSGGGSGSKSGSKSPNPTDDSKDKNPDAYDSLISALSKAPEISKLATKTKTDLQNDKATFTQQAKSAAKLDIGSATKATPTKTPATSKGKWVTRPSVVR